MVKMNYQKPWFQFMLGHNDHWGADWILERVNHNRSFEVVSFHPLQNFIVKDTWHLHCQFQIVADLTHVLPLIT